MQHPSSNFAPEPLPEGDANPSSTDATGAPDSSNDGSDNKQEHAAAEPAYNYASVHEACEAREAEAAVDEARRETSPLELRKDRDVLANLSPRVQKSFANVKGMRVETEDSLYQAAITVAVALGYSEDHISIPHTKYEFLGGTPADTPHRTARSALLPVAKASGYPAKRMQARRISTSCECFGFWSPAARSTGEPGPCSSGPFHGTLQSGNQSRGKPKSLPRMCHVCAACRNVCAAAADLIEVVVIGERIARARVPFRRVLRVLRRSMTIVLARGVVARACGRLKSAFAGAPAGRAHVAKLATKASLTID